MHPIHDLEIPARRNLQPVRDALDGLARGTVASAKFYSRRYGPFIVDGTVKDFGGDLHIAGFFLGHPRVPGSELYALHAGDVLEYAPGLVGGAVFGHGDIGGASLHNDGHGDYTITGPAIGSHNRDGLTIASWFLDHSNTVKVELVAAAPDHQILIPPILGDLDTVVPTDSDQT